VPACLPNLLQRVLPSVVSVIAAPANHPEMLLERSLDLLPVLLKPATAEHARAVHAATYTHVLALGHASDDNGTVQSVATVLRMFVSKGGEALLTWGPHATPQDNLQVSMHMTLCGLARPAPPSLHCLWRNLDSSRAANDCLHLGPKISVQH